MEKFFQPNKWFVMFCAILIAVFVLLQSVSNMRVLDGAKAVARDLFTWQWDDCDASVDITDASVLKKTETDAVVQVKGRQSLRFAPPDNKMGSKERAADVTATLTFYKSQNDWFLGKVELQ